MKELLGQYCEHLGNLCAQFDVERLDLFGSAARGDFNPASSDLDFLVAFRRDGQLGAADRYLGLLAALEDLFGRKIDLVDVSAARNPYFMAEALKHRVMLYTAPDVRELKKIP
jgi:predicted nucleotidyltransferase